MINDDERSKFMKDMMSTQTELEKHLKSLEKSIFDMETKYLDTTQNTGNILKGWDQIYTAKSKIQQTGNFKKSKYSNSERMFSSTSLNNPAMKELGSIIDSTLRNSMYLNLSSSTNKNSVARRRKKILKKKLGGYNADKDY